MRTTSFDFDNPEARFKVLINHEEQYSLWPADLEVPGGWDETGVCAAKDECDKYLEETWTDMRPKSLRIALDGNGNGDAGAADSAPKPEAKPEKNGSSRAKTKKSASG